MNREATSTAFWFVVVDCLVQFHHLGYDEAHKKVKALRARLREIPSEYRADSEALVYHEEPFYVACNLQGKRLELAQYREAYDKIAGQHGW